MDQLQPISFGGTRWPAAASAPPNPLGLQTLTFFIAVELSGSKMRPRFFRVTAFLDDAVRCGAFGERRGACRLPMGRREKSLPTTSSYLPGEKRVKYSKVSPPSSPAEGRASSPRTSSDSPLFLSKMTVSLPAGSPCRYR